MSIPKSPNSTQGVQMASDNKSAIITIRPQDAWARYRLTVTNTCGSFFKDYRFNASATNCPIIGEIEPLISPNPTSSRITVDLKGTEIVSIRIKDKFGNVVKAMNNLKNTGIVQVDLTQLKTDVYVVEVFNGRTWQSKKLIKN